ncbi:hypothetical protein MCEORH2_00597 [Methylophilaceae bacterium]
MMCEQHHSFMGNVLLLVTNRYSNVTERNYISGVQI